MDFKLCKNDNLGGVSGQIIAASKFRSRELAVRGCALTKTCSLVSNLFDSKNRLKTKCGSYRELCYAKLAPEGGNCRHKK